MKKLIALLLAVLMIVGMTACAQKSDSDLDYIKGNKKTVQGY